MSGALRDRIVVVTVGLSGADGASELSRQWVAALAPLAAAGDADLEVWSLEDRERPACLDALRVGFRSAQGSRMTFASFGLRPGDVDERTRVVVTHIHLLPVLLPLLYRGARVAVLLLGIEAWKPLRRLTARALRQCWRVLAISQHTIDRFRQANPSLGNVPVRVCAPGVPPDCAGGDARPPLADADHPSRPCALIVGRMSSEERYKGHDELIRLWPQVQAEVPDARLVVAGTGDDEARLRARVQDAGLRDSIVFTGRVSNEQRASLYRNARFFVMPSRNEGFGFVYLEAMRMGKPCIVAAGAAEEIVDDNVQGFVIQSGDDAALVRAMVRLCVDDQLCTRMGAAAAARVASHFTQAHFCERVYEALELRAVPVAC